MWSSEILIYGIVGWKKITAAVQTEHLELLCQIEIIYLHFLAELHSSRGVWAEKL